MVFAGVPSQVFNVFVGQAGDVQVIVAEEILGPLPGAVYRAPGAGNAALGVEEVDGVLLVSTWFRRHPDERTRTLTPAEAWRVVGG